ncbi:MAG: sulfite exporter TauE/SafE family protein [Polyangiales bacterium]
MHSLLTIVSASFAAGLAAAPHCALMCGPLAVAACGGRAGGGGRSTAAYMASRLTAYALAGALFGAVGAGLLHRVDVQWARRAAALGVAASLLAAAWRLYRSRPATAAPLVPLRRSKERPSVVRGAMVGLLTGALPCGALAGAWLLAASAGSAGAGALAMVTYGAVSALGLGAALTVGAAGARIPVPRVLGALALVAVGLWVGARPWLTRTPAGCHCGHGTVVARAEAR